MRHPTPHAADLAVGDRIHPDHPPHCCGQPMAYYGIGDLSLWECGTCRRGIGTDANGIVDYLKENTVNECQNCGAPGGWPYCNEDCRDAAQCTGDNCPDCQQGDNQ